MGKPAPFIEVTTKIGCKNMCSYCPQELLISAYKKISNVYDMSFDTFKRYIDKLPKKVDISFSGYGEPWFNKECTKMVLYAYQMGHRLTVFSTLSDMKEDDVGQIKKIRFKSFIVHLPDKDANTKIEINNEYKNVLKKVTESVPNAVYLYFDNIHPELIETLKSVKILRMVPETRANNLQIKGVETYRINGPIKCTRHLNQNVLLPNGDVVLCCEDFGLRHILGNLLEKSYNELFESSEYKRIVTGLKDDSEDILCRYCEKYAKKAGKSKKLGFWGRLMKTGG